MARKCSFLTRVVEPGGMRRRGKVQSLGEGGRRRGTDSDPSVLLRGKPHISGRVQLALGQRVTGPTTVVVNGNNHLLLHILAACSVANAPGHTTECISKIHTGHLNTKSLDYNSSRTFKNNTLYLQFTYTGFCFRLLLLSGHICA